MNMVVETAVNGVSDSDYTVRHADKRCTASTYSARSEQSEAEYWMLQHDAYSRRAGPLPRHGGHPAVRRAVVHGRDGGRSGHRHGPHGPGFGGARLVVPPEREGRMGPVRLVHVKKKGKENDRP